MSRRLPPLASLRVFECAARHLNFTKAGEELCVTQAAVSHQIKALEEWVGTPLFKRLNRTIRLTAAGERMLGPLTQAFDLMATATRQAVGAGDPMMINVATWDSFLSLWLLPRLHRFRSAHPNMQVRFYAKYADDLLASGDADVEIRYGNGHWPVIGAKHLLSEEIFPVCSPSLITAEAPLDCLRDLGRHELLHDVYSIDWSSFLGRFGISEIDTSRGVGFTHSHLVLQACRAGEGVALGRSVLVADDLRDGRLVRPLRESLPSDSAYHVVYRMDEEDKPTVKSFVSWLIDESRLFQMDGARWSA